MPKRDELAELRRMLVVFHNALRIDLDDPGDDFWRGLKYAYSITIDEIDRIRRARRRVKK